MIVSLSCVQKQLQEYDFQFSAWPTDFDVADVEGYVLLHVVFLGSGFNQARGSGSGFKIRIRIQEGKNDLQKVQNLHGLKSWMFSFEGRRLLL
jgi:hypothetical protein